MIAKLICRFLGHRWRKTSEFTGGIEYKCDRCEKRYTSFAACPSHQPYWDADFYQSGKVVG